MGTAKDTIHGPGAPPSSTPPPDAGKAKKKKSFFAKSDKKQKKSLIKRIDDFRDEVSKLTHIKDNDVLAEGDAAKAENQRKAGLLRSAHSALTTAKNILKDY